MPSVDLAVGSGAALTIPVGAASGMSGVLPGAEDLNRYLAEQQRSLARLDTVHHLEMRPVGSNRASTQSTPGIPRWVVAKIKITISIQTLILRRVSTSSPLKSTLGG